MRLSDPPLVSIIIPSAGKRPQLLRRAIDTSIAGWGPGEVEIVIVFNGSNGSSDSGLIDSSIIRTLSLPEANVCKARNWGIQASRGLLIRFLDDDDFLIPHVAVRQCRELLDSAAQVSSYAVAIQDEEGKPHGELRQPSTSDFVAGQLGESRVQIPLAHVYRKAALGNIQWNPQYAVSEDTVWLLSIASKRDLTWIKSDEVAGVWYQHRGPRLSYAHAAHEPHRITAESILATVEQLQVDGRMNEERRLAATCGLWACVHRGFYLKPFYWHKVAKIALSLERKLSVGTAGSRALLLSPLIVEWLMLPKRMLNHLVRRLQSLCNGWGYVRRL